MNIIFFDWYCSFQSAMTSNSSLPLPLDPPPPPEADEKRLWIGNLDTRLTEFHLIKVLQKYGKITKFDFLFHKSGPLKGQPRGYSFVTYETKQEAVHALKSLNGKMMMKKAILVKWAHTVPTDDYVPKKTPQQALSDEPQKNKNVHIQINAIEAKLKAMEDQREKELELCLSDVPTTESRSPLLNSRPTLKVHRNREGCSYYKTQRKTYVSRSTKRR